MSVPPSNAAKLPLPQWAYVPGETAEAEADHDTLWQAMALVPSRFQDFVPAGGRERILLRACIQIANANLRLRMQKPRAAARFFGEALSELDTLGRNAMTAGAGFVDAFPTAALAALLKAKLAQPTLAKADWVEFGKIGPA